MTKHWAADAFGPDPDEKAPPLADSLADEVLRLRFAMKDALAVLDDRRSNGRAARHRAAAILRKAVGGS